MSKQREEMASAAAAKSASAQKKVTKSAKPPSRQAGLVGWGGSSASLAEPPAAAWAPGTAPETIAAANIRTERARRRAKKKETQKARRAEEEAERNRAALLEERRARSRAEEEASDKAFQDRIRTNFFKTFVDETNNVRKQLNAAYAKLGNRLEHVAIDGEKLVIKVEGMPPMRRNEAEARKMKDTMEDVLYSMEMTRDIKTARKVFKDAKKAAQAHKNWEMNLRLPAQVEREDAAVRKLQALARRLWKNRDERFAKSFFPGGKNYKHLEGKIDPHFFKVEYDGSGGIWFRSQEKPDTGFTKTELQALLKPSYDADW